MKDRIDVDFLALMGLIYQAADWGRPHGYHHEADWRESVSPEDVERYAAHLSETEGPAYGDDVRSTIPAWLAKSGQP